MMKFNVLKKAKHMDAIAIGVFEDEVEKHPYASEIFVEKILPLVKKNVINGKFKTLTPLVHIDVKVSDSVFVFGLGKRADFEPNKLRYMAAEVIRQAEKYACSNLAFFLPQNFDGESISQAVVEGIILGNYRFEMCLTEKKEDHVKEVSLVGGEYADREIKAGLKLGVVVANSVNFSRDLANTPSNILFPKAFVDQAKELFKGTAVKVTVIDKKEAKKLGMEAFLGVAQGSAFEPYLLRLDYVPNKDEKPICLVGKGVTFDTGGISIKPAANMKEMKGDMGGAANVISAMKGISELGLKRNVVALIPLAENMPSATAQRPGDVVTAMNGKTIEISNTDAEGRLILCDALSYAVAKVKPALIIDTATLTGAVIIALGIRTAGILGNNQALVDELLTVSKRTGERMWQLPMFEDYIDHLKSDVADINHCNEGREAGTITAAKFLEQFVDNIPWAHIDIAGVMRTSATKGHTLKGMSGEGTRNLIEFVRSH